MILGTVQPLASEVDLQPPAIEVSVVGNLVGVGPALMAAADAHWFAVLLTAAARAAELSALNETHVQRREAVLDAMPTSLRQAYREQGR